MKTIILQIKKSHQTQRTTKMKKAHCNQSAQTSNKEKILKAARGKKVLYTEE